jgi:hypothetical protein
VNSATYGAAMANDQGNYFTESHDNISTKPNQGFLHWWKQKLHFGFNKQKFALSPMFGETYSCPSSS